MEIEYSDKYLEMVGEVLGKEFVCDNCECVLKPTIGDKLSVQSKTLFELFGSDYLDDTNFYIDMNLCKFPDGFVEGDDEYVYTFPISKEFLSDQEKIEHNSYIAQQYRVVWPYGRVIKREVGFRCPVCNNVVSTEHFEIPECVGLINVHTYGEEDDMIIDRLYTKLYTTDDGDEFMFNIGIGGDESGNCDEKVIKFLEIIGFKENEEDRLDIYFKINSYE